MIILLPETDTTCLPAEKLLTHAELNTQTFMRKQPQLYLQLFFNACKSTMRTTAIQAY